MKQEIIDTFKYYFLPLVIASAIVVLILSFVM